MTSEGKEEEGMEGGREGGWGNQTKLDLQTAIMVGKENQVWDQMSEVERKT